MPRLLGKLGFVFFLSVMSASAVQAVTPGSWLSRLLNRGQLREYAKKIEDRKITAAELRDYIEKGGNVHEWESYDAQRNFFVGTAPRQLMNYFIGNGSSRFRPESADDFFQATPNELDCLRLLLSVGADPNAEIKTDPHAGYESIPPILYAAGQNDLEAFKLLAAAGGKIDLRFEGYAATYGPPFVETSSIALKEYLLGKGVRLERFADGSTFLHVPENGIAISVRLYKWYLQKVPADSKDAEGRTPLDTVLTAKKSAQGSYRKSLEDIEALLRAKLRHSASSF